MLNLLVSLSLLVAPLPNGGRVELHSGQCEQEVRKFIPAEVAPRFQKAVVVWDGKTLKACWALATDGSAVMIVDETGDGGFAPPSVFKRPIEASK